jgi:hypothetical protein
MFPALRGRVFGFDLKCGRGVKGSPVVVVKVAPSPHLIQKVANLMQGNFCYFWSKGVAF